MLKKVSLCVLLFGFIFLAGCGLKWDNNTTTETSETNNSTGVNQTAKNSVKGKYSFTNSDCQQYVTLMECLIDKTPDVAKDQTISSFEKVMELWKWLDAAALPSTCKNTIDMLQNQKDVFEKAGCSIK